MGTFNVLIWTVFLKALAVLYGYIDKKHSQPEQRQGTSTCWNIHEVFDMDITLEQFVWNNDFCGFS